ncbi:hypothetical protein DL98DRAFT_585107 [Cadophora sp. DSE1049]|nr:hypothetical protein DL98DRAFT_585107 [Cadophora sp. DSE1049]
MAHKRTHDDYIYDDVLETAMLQSPSETSHSDELSEPCQSLDKLDNTQIDIDAMVDDPPTTAEKEELSNPCKSSDIVSNTYVDIDALLEDAPSTAGKDDPNKPSTSSDLSAALIEDLSSAAAKVQEQLLSINVLKPTSHHKTLESFKLYTFKEGTPLYWNIAKQQLMRVYLPERATNLHLGKLIVKICRLLAFTATEISQDELSKIIPNEVLDVVLPQGTRNKQKNSSVFRGWNKTVVKKLFIQDGPTYGAARLDSCGLWPPSEASLQLRQEMWDLCFVPDIVELVFGAWHGAGIIDLRKIMSTPDSIICKWLNHVYVVLLEIRFRFGIPSGDTKKSCALSRSLLNEGVAKNCLARESWDEVIEHFETDVFSTWEGERIDYKSVDCTPGFGKTEITDKSAKWKFLRRFTADLRQRAPERFPPSLRQHFRDNPPRFPGRMKQSAPEAVNKSEENTNGCVSVPIKVVNGVPNESEELLGGRRDC